MSDLMSLSLAGISVVNLKRQAERFRLITAMKCDKNFGRNRRQTGIMTTLVNGDGKYLQFLGLVDGLEWTKNPENSQNFHGFLGSLVNGRLILIPVYNTSYSTQR